VPDGKPPGVDFEGLLKTLHGSGVEFIVVGGAAAAAAGSTRLTLDLDVVYARTSANLTALASALSPLSPYLRGAPPGLPFQWDEATLRRGLNFTLTTSLGDIDLLGEITGGGGFDALLPHSVELTLFGIPCRCLGLDKLIEVKRAAGRPKDLEAVAELEAIREERRKLGR
jgi:hypothetical protein